MSDEQKTGRVQIVMAPVHLRTIDDRSSMRRIRSEATRRLIRLGREAEEPRANAAAALTGGGA